MHIAEGVLSAPVLITGAVVAAGAVAYGLKKLDPRQVMMAAILGAAFFVASLIHIPVGPSSVHLLLNGLLGVLLGWSAVPVIFVGLLLQAILYGFGGLTVLGVNTATMGLGAVLSWYIFGGLLSVLKPLGAKKAAAVSGFVSGACGVAIAAVLTALALVLLAAAVSLLSAADNAFAALTAGLRRLLTVQSVPDVFLELILSLPVGAYLYGLALGTRRTEPAALAARTARLDGALAKLRRVPETVWCVLTGCFCAVYLLFFAVQGSYLFGAFRHRLPAGFTVAQYARQGFFQLCMVMGVNFLLLWLVTHSSRALNRPGRIMCTVLLAQSILLAVTALSKLALYIACFGFTPLRLQSSWLVCVLLAGCAAWLVSLWTARRTCRAWLLFSGVTLALLCFV